MIELRPQHELGETDLGWLNASHHFCFARYQRVDRMSWGQLRTLNFNRLAPRTAHPPAQHFRMDIMLVVQAGDLRVAVKGKGVRKLTVGDALLLSSGSEAILTIANPHKSACEYIEIWLTPDCGNAAAYVERCTISALPSPVLATGFRHADGMHLRAEAQVSWRVGEPGKTLTVPLERACQGYAVALEGRARLKSGVFGTGDALAVCDEKLLTLDVIDKLTLLVVETRAVGITPSHN